MATLLVLVGGFAFAQDALPQNLLLLREQATADAPSAIYRVDLPGRIPQEILPAAAGYFYVSMDGERLLLHDAEDQFFWLDVAGNLTPIEEAPPSRAEILADSQQLALQEITAETDIALDTLYPPERIVLQLPDAQNLTLYAMSGANDPFINLYRLADDELAPLTDVLALFPAAAEPYLSASVEIIAVHPQQNGFLYRARLRDSAGVDHNALHFFDLEANSSRAMPFFGKDPIFSPDGQQMVGSRLRESPPLYELWQVDLATGEEQKLAPGCYPQWSADGRWIAFDQHDDPRWQGYVDCFVNGEVAIYDTETGEIFSLTESLDGNVQVIGWAGE